MEVRWQESIVKYFYCFLNWIYSFHIIYIIKILNTT